MSRVARAVYLKFCSYAFCFHDGFVKCSCMDVLVDPSTVATHLTLQGERHLFGNCV